MTDALLTVAGFIAGFIDSIAGGGGLITVPIFALILGPGPAAIGTNKIVAVISSAAALWIYWRGGHVSVKGSRRFAIFVGLGAMTGATLSPFVPAHLYKALIVAIAPVILWIVFRKEIWVKSHIEDKTGNHNSLIFWLSGFACGFYDGIAGPGGGTLMFLALFLAARLPLLTSMATAKVANLTSASVSLATFTVGGHVVWNQGLFMGIGIGVGAMVGASFATRKAATLARWALLVVSSLLLLRLLFH